MSVSESTDVLAQTSSLRWIGYGLAAAGAAATVMRLVQPGPLWTGVLLVTAVAGLSVVARTPEAFEIKWRGGDRKLNGLVGAPAYCLFFIGLAVQVDDFTLPVAGAAAGAALALMASMRGLGRPGLNSRVTDQVLMAVFGAMLGYGGVVALDVDYDRSAPVVVAAPVLEKWITHGRSSTTYHMRLPPFGARRAGSSIVVDRDTYAALSPGEQVCVIEHRGAIGVPWITSKLCDH